MAPRAVIFDFDFTLADSSAGVIDCVRTAQGRMGLPRSDPEAIRRTIGLSVPDTLAALCGEGQRPRSAEFGRLFRERADEVMAPCTVVYAAVPGVLRRLRAGGERCGIATTKFRYRIEAILLREGLDGLVDAVVGAEDVAVHKPDPACLRLALDRLGVAAAEALYVGDSWPDAEAARRAGIAFVAVGTGTTDWSPGAEKAVRPSRPGADPPSTPGGRSRAAGAPTLADLKPAACLQSVADLPDWLEANHPQPEGAVG